MTPDPLVSLAENPAPSAPVELAERYNEGITSPPPPLRVEMLLPRQPVSPASVTFTSRQRFLLWAVLLGTLLFCAALAYLLWGAG